MTRVEKEAIWCVGSIFVLSFVIGAGVLVVAALWAMYFTIKNKTA